MLLTFYATKFTFCIICSNTNEEQRRSAKRLCLDPFAELCDGSAEGSTAPVTSNAREELARYKALRVPASCSTPLEYWKTQALDFPILSHVARKLLAMSASSAQSKRGFSSVGRTITEACFQLSSEATELVRWGLRSKTIESD